jgi:serine/threonine protein kinase
VLDVRKSTDTQEYDRPERSFAVPTRMSDYLANPLDGRMGEEVGSGGSSTVKVIVCPVAGKRVAVKYFGKGTLDEGRFIQEADALSRLNHHCVLRIHGWAYPEGTSHAQIHSEFAANGSLDDVMRRIKSGKLPNWNANRMAIIICDIILGMKYVHSQGIIHRDLKPSNVLITDHWRGLIGDFGSSRFAADDATLSEPSGTVHYAAPELFIEGAECTTRADIWSFGLVVFELLVGRPVFSSSLSPFDVIRKHRNRELPTIPDRCGPFMQHLIGRCLSMAPEDRPSFDEIFRESEAHNFDIVPGGELCTVFDAVQQVLLWEKRQQ